MLVYLRIDQGPHAGRRIDLKPGQTASLGSTDYADFCFEKDQQMADVHLRVSIDQNDVRLDHLSQDHETLVNGQPVSTTPVQNGDQIQFGQTQMNVIIEKLTDVPANEWVDNGTSSAENTASEPELDLKQLAKNLEFSDEAKLIAHNHSDANSLLEDLKAQPHWDDSIKLQAYLLPNHEAVAWIANTINEISEIELSGEQLAAFNAASNWGAEPSENKRRLCEKLAEENESEGIGGMLAMASFFSDGSIAPEGAEDDVLVEDFVASVVLAGVVATAIGDCSPGNTEDLYRMFLQRAEPASTTTK